MKEKSVPKRWYTGEFKAEAARLAQTARQHKAAHRLGVPVATLGNWVRKHQKDKNDSSHRRRRTSGSSRLPRNTAERSGLRHDY